MKRRMWWLHRRKTKAFSSRGLFHLGIVIAVPLAPLTLAYYLIRKIGSLK